MLDKGKTPPWAMLVLGVAVGTAAYLRQGLWYEGLIGLGAGVYAAILANFIRLYFWHRKIASSQHGAFGMWNDKADATGVDDEMRTIRSSRIEQR